MKPPTLVNHPPHVPVPADNQPVVAPIYQTVKFEFDTVAETLRALRGERGGFYYQRTSNPTTRQLELTLAGLQGRDECIACGSGVGAIAGTLLSLTKQGDHVLCFVESYGPTRHLIRRLLAKFGLTHSLISLDDLAGMERVLAHTPARLVMFESPSNPINKIADLQRITELAHAHGALAVMDNTLAGLHQHGEYPVDVFMHSLTKFAAGHGDVMGGAVIASAELIKRMRPDFSVLGGVLDPHAAFLIQRGLKTYFVRYQQQCESALRLAESLQTEAAVSAVYYPALPGNPYNALCRKQMAQAGAVVTFDLHGGSEVATRFVEALRLFAMTASLGATESLVLPPQLLAPHDLDAEQLRISGVGPGTVRLCVGLEHSDDLLADVAQALRVAQQ
ncbi:MAG TPA: aminotransferase class I/II-fold pyridoxal phosphate-dependent enzyme [Steroidobacteraceae bacterium]